MNLAPPDIERPDIERPDIERPDIERMVREVLRQIDVRRSANTVERAAAVAVAGQPVATTDNCELELTGKVISLSQIEGKLDGVRTVTARASAVVTPSVRDYLRQHDVQLTLRVPDGNRQLGAILWLASCATRCDTQGLRDDLEQRGVSCRVLADTSLPAIATQLARRLDGQATAVILTSEPEVATCAVNRHPSIRGFVATDVATLTKAQRATGGNLLIVDPANCSGTDICEMACGMAIHAPTVPSQWRGIL